MHFDEIMDLLHEVNVWSAGFRVLLALLLGGLIGLERGRHGRAAGLRTHILVCVGAAVAALVGLYSCQVLSLGGDAMRIGAQVISGIGFLGVGTILVRNRDKVTGLTTAAGLWATACIGLAVGVGFYSVALFAFLAVSLTMSLLIYLERAIKCKEIEYSCYIEITDAEDFNPLYNEIKPLVSHTEIVPARSGIATHVGVELSVDSLENYQRLLEYTEKSREVVISLPG
jgi:putative Mg2+ transporter-C (MgtC) family protein